MLGKIWDTVGIWQASCKKLLNPQFLSKKKYFSKADLISVGFLKNILLTLIEKQKLR